MLSETPRQATPEATAQVTAGTGKQGCRIAVLHQGFVPSYRVRFYELLNEISDHDYVVFHGDPLRGTGFEKTPGPFAFPNVPVRNVELRLGRHVAVYQPVIAAILRGGFDAIVIGHEVKFLASMLLFALFKARGQPVILWGHGYHRANASWPARRCSSALARASDGYLAYTAKSADLLRAAGVASERIHVLMNTIDIAAEMEAHAHWAKQDKAALKAVFGLDPASLPLLYVGRLSERKRIGELIDAVARLNREGGLPPVDLLIVGDGPEREALTQRAHGSERVHFLGALFDPQAVGKVMRLAVAAVIPDAVGLAVNHAFAHGLPVVTARSALHGPEIDYIRNGENGLIVDERMQSFTGVLRALLRSATLQKRLARGALATRDSLGLDRAVQLFDKGVNEVLAQHPRTAEPRRAAA